MSDKSGGGYQFVTCDECSKNLLVGDPSDYSIKCGNCGNVQSSDTGRGQKATVEQRRSMLYLITQPTRFEILQCIYRIEDEKGRVAHSTATEAIDGSMTTAYEHLQKLVEGGVLDRHKVPYDERSRDEPRVYYWFTDAGVEHFEFVTEGD